MALLVKNNIAGVVASSSFGVEVVVGPATSAPENAESAATTITGAAPTHAYVSNTDGKTRTR